jgi:KipI family sensor histidine kinase inhibitor
MTSEPRLIPIGSEALLVDLGSRERAAAAYRLARRAVDADPAAARDVVPAATTVLIDGVADRERWRSTLSAAAIEAAMHSADPAAPDAVVIAVRYDGPDLAVVAQAWGCSSAEVVERHCSAAFTVAFCGFAPGFAYCTSDPPLPVVPRRLEPRSRVPSGSVALAAGFCGVYPRAVPGGWQLIGTTDAVLFDPTSDRPALLAPATPVRFEAL